MLDCTEDNTYTIRNICINFERGKNFNLIKQLHPGKMKNKSLSEMVSYVDSDSEPLPLWYFRDTSNYLHFYKKRRNNKTIFSQMRFVHDRMKRKGKSYSGYKCKMEID